MVTHMPRRGVAKGWIVGAIVVVLLAALLSLARFYTDVLWFEEVGFKSVLFTSIYTQLFVGLIVGVVTGALVWGNLLLAARLAPAYRIPGRRGDPLERYRDLLLPHLKWVRLGVAVIVGILAGTAAGSTWQDYLLWANRVPFGLDDPQFGRDIGFFVFELPWFKDLTDFAWFALMAALVVSAVAHFFHGSIRPELGMRGVASGALAHLSVLLGCLALVKAVQYWLGRFELSFSTRGVVTGATYTDVNAQLPALTILAIISVVSAILFLVNIRFRTVILPLAAVAIWVLFSVLAGGLWPWWVQRFSVEPQELVRERPFIENNIESTRRAFGLADMQVESYPGTASLTPDEVQQNEALLQNVRLWDPLILQKAMAQLQQIRSYYLLQDVDVDRYPVDGEMRQVLIAARELSLQDLPANSQRWPNVHLQFTHGNGVVASLANASTATGQPEFLVRDIPGTVDEGAESLEAEQARFYFGESFAPTEYSVVNTDQPELDFETDEGVETTNYDGEGGVRVGGLFRRVAFAVRELDRNLILSGQITSDSRIMLYKNVRDRVHRAAPFLYLDNDPYPAVVDGRVVWILDAYTTTTWYPYSERVDLDGVIDQGQVGALAGDANYIRNSVKVVVDAYHGTLDFYIIDESDPLIRAWRNAFPDLFIDEEPSEELAAHFRYPEDLFKVQSEIFRAYHVTDPDVLFSGVDEWAIPSNVQDQFSSVERDPQVQPTYLLLELPGESEQEFVLTRPFTPRQRDNMRAVMVARSDPDHYGELLTLDFSRSVIVKGPKQIDNLINQVRELAEELSLLRQGGSQVDFGSLVLLPIEDSILYVQPFFVTAEDGGIPELKRVILVLGDDIVFADTFELALADLFELEEPPIAGDPDQPTEPTEPGEPEEPGTGDAELDRIVSEAARLYAQAQDALREGDLETYGRLIDQVGDLLGQAQEISSGS